MLSNNIEQPELVGTSKRGFLLLIFIFLGIAANAQNFQSTSLYLTVARHSETKVDKESRYRPYQSTIYEPFAASVTGSSDSHSGEQSAINNRRNAWGGGGMGDEEGDDAGHRDPNSPIGDPWIMLLFAAVAAVVVYRKRIVSQNNN